MESTDLADGKHLFSIAQRDERIKFRELEDIMQDYDNSCRKKLLEGFDSMIRMQMHSVNAHKLEYTTQAAFMNQAALFFAIRYNLPETFAERSIMLPVSGIFGNSFTAPDSFELLAKTLLNPEWREKNMPPDYEIQIPEGVQKSLGGIAFIELMQYSYFTKKGATKKGAEPKVTKDFSDKRREYLMPILQSLDDEYFRLAKFFIEAETDPDNSFWTSLFESVLLGGRLKGIQVSEQGLNPEHWNLIEWSSTELNEYSEKLMKRFELESKLFIQPSTAPEDFTEKFAELVGEHNQELIYNFLKQIPGFIHSATQLGITSKDPPIKLELSDGRIWYPKVRPTGLARRSYIMTEIVRSLNPLLSKKWAPMLEIPFEQEGNCVVLCPEAGIGELPENILKDKLKTLAYLHTLGKKYSDGELFLRVKDKSPDEIKELLGHGGLGSKYLEFASAYSELWSELHSDKNDLTIIHGDAHLDNVLSNGVFIDQESTGIGHPYVDVSTVLFDTIQGRTLEMALRYELFNFYLSKCREIQKLPTLSGKEYLEHWKKFLKIALVYEAPWRIARVINYSHLRDEPYRQEQRQLLTNLITEYFSNRERFESI